ncbi:gluconate 2-dehydrogenase subunit 3 family protein [uncultured Leifsonia sp.]|uniref:gluconate 2-dehydrogenase subunit 3 family protein n=1 Tax=uncultured Leifsonia sp. TaxID=340359 RepID=UPI0025D770F7|nr:gluconate 2-dehydrogenase subunit 3 family protein [uncultured Leifsonia sp.]
MTARNLRDEVPERFPGFRVLDQAKHWDDETRAVVYSRVGRPPDIRFFDAAEEAAATALFDRLLDQHPDDRRVPVTAMVDARLAEKETDGWHYDSMGDDWEVWKISLAALDAEAHAVHGRAFAACDEPQQLALLSGIHDGDGEWRGFHRARIWSLWTRYACTAYYSHPAAWDEIGFAGPAYPRGYKNLGLDSREPFEVADAQPDDMPRTGTAGS